MSLALIQGYSSAEDEEKPTAEDFLNSSSDEDGGGDGDLSRRSHSVSYKSVFDSLTSQSVGSSGLPSAFDAFSEISGPPQFLNNSVEEHANSRNSEQQQGRRGHWKNRKEKKDLPAGAVVESKAQLVGIHERVRSDVEVSHPSKASVTSATQDGGKRMPMAANPSAEDAAELLRVCLHCRIPKTYSSARGMFCPLCNDRPIDDLDKESKKKGSSTIKEKEKSKRMKGQSSHATWKSETEMQLRQQFD